MPDVLEQPKTEQIAKPFVPPFTDPEFARLAGQRSSEAKRERAQELENLRALLAKPIEPPQERPNEPLIVQQEVSQQLELSQEQIARTRTRLNSDDCGDKERAGLLREMRGFMELRLRLRGIGEPGRVRPAQEPARGRRTVGPIAQPIDRPASCASNTTTGCSPESQPTQSRPQDAQEPNG